MVRVKKLQHSAVCKFCRFWDFKYPCMYIVHVPTCILQKGYRVRVGSVHVHTGTWCCVSIHVHIHCMCGGMFFMVSLKNWENFKQSCTDKTCLLHMYILFQSLVTSVHPSGNTSCSNIWTEIFCRFLITSQGSHRSCGHYSCHVVPPSLLIAFMGMC